MSYRPICDTWILARPKVAYYGAYPAGFLSRARALLACRIDEPVLHVCSGKVKEYPYKGLGMFDCTMDLDPALQPDFCQDVRQQWPTYPGGFLNDGTMIPWAGILCDPPYSEEDATHYACGATVYPKPGEILKRAWEVLEPGRRVGILHYQWPTPPKDAICVAVVTVLVGYGNKARLYSVFEKPAVEA